MTYHHKKTSRLRLMSIALCGALLLSACASSVPTPETWRGTSTDATNVVRQLTVELKRSGANLYGTYSLENSSGSLTGVVNGSSITAALRPSESCVYDFSGSLTDTTLTGEYIPTGCPGGVGGTWSLTRD